MGCHPFMSLKYCHNMKPPAGEVLEGRGRTGGLTLSCLDISHSEPTAPACVTQCNKGHASELLLGLQSVKQPAC